MAASSSPLAKREVPLSVFPKSTCYPTRYSSEKGSLKSKGGGFLGLLQADVVEGKEDPLFLA